MTQAQKTAKEKFKKAIEYRKKTGVSLKEAFAHVYGKKVGAVKKAPVKKASSGKHVDTKSHNVNIKIVSGIGNIENSIYKIVGVKLGVKKYNTRDGIDFQIINLDNKQSIIYISQFDTEKDIINNISPKLSNYIFNTTTESYNSKQADLIKKNVLKLCKLLLKELKKLNKSVKKVPAKKVAIKKKAVKKVSRPSRSTKKVKATYKVNYQTGTSNRTTRGKNQDSKRKALAPGKRTSASGNTYYETRANRSDFSRSVMTGIEDKMFKDLYNVREKIANTKQAILKLQGYKNNVPLSQKYQYTLKIKQFKKYLVELNTHYKELKKYI